MGRGLRFSKPLEQGLSNDTFPSGLGAIDDTIPTWCYVWLGGVSMYPRERMGLVLRLTDIKVARARICCCRQGNLWSRIDRMSSSGS